jgi:hypothetical protein
MIFGLASPGQCNVECVVLVGEHSEPRKFWRFLRSFLTSRFEKFGAQ